MQKLIKPLSFIAVLVFLLFSFSFVYKNQASAFICDGCDFECCCGCPTATPTDTPNGCPTPTPTDEPTPTPSDEPTPTPSDVPTSTPTSTPGTSNGGGNGGTSDSGPPHCGDTAPNAPYLVSATRTASVSLLWQKPAGANRYSIEYGPSSGDYMHSVVDTGDVDTYLIGGIDNGCFAVRAWNGCAASPLSNEVCTGQVQGQVLGASTLGATGKSEEALFNSMFVLGLLSVGFSFKKLLQG